MNLVLIGYRGTGKSTVARHLGRTLGWPVVSLDEELVLRAQCSISDFVTANGWPAFRDLETAVIREVVRRDCYVIDCGGGVVERPENEALLVSAGPIVWLTATIPTVVRRISSGTERPSLTGKSITEEVGEVLARREPIYGAWSQLRVATDVLTPREVAEAVLAQLPSLRGPKEGEPSRD